MEIYELAHPRTRWQFHLHLYRVGDFVGAPFEGGEGPTSPASLYKKLKTRYSAAIIMSDEQVAAWGTDETAIANAYQVFSEHLDRPQRSYGYPQYPLRDDLRANGNYLHRYLYAWLRFHADNRLSTRYGRTWNSHFALVRFIEDHKPEAFLETVCKISAEKNSFGNGCLPLVYPFFLHGLKYKIRHPAASGFFWRAPPTSAEAVLDALVSTTHAHAEAREACIHLYKFFKNRGDYRNITKRMPHYADWVGKNTMHVKGCLATAMHCALGSYNDWEVLEKASKIGGDMDSYLSLALLMRQYMEDCRRYPSISLSDLLTSR